MLGNRFDGDAPFVRLPQAPTTVTPATAFVVCPVVCQPVSPAQWCLQQALYAAAFAEARAVVQPSLPERDLVAVWN
jgi:hypothetical protein